MSNKRIYCKYCGAKLRKDHVGQYCPTKNCQWQYGVPAEKPTPPKKGVT